MHLIVLRFFSVMDISEHMTGKWLGIRKYPLPKLSVQVFQILEYLRYTNVLPLCDLNPH